MVLHEAVHESLIDAPQRDLRARFHGPRQPHGSSYALLLLLRSRLIHPQYIYFLLIIVEANRGIVADEGNEGLVIVHAYFPRSRSPSIDEACQSILKNMAPKKPPSLAAIAQIKLLPPIV